MLQSAIKAPSSLSIITIRPCYCQRYWNYASKMWMSIQSMTTASIWSYFRYNLYSKLVGKSARLRSWLLRAASSIAPKALQRRIPSSSVWTKFPSGMSLYLTQQSTVCCCSVAALHLMLLSHYSFRQTILNELQY